MGVEAVSVYSTADKNMPFRKLADKSICIGGPHSRDSYLNSYNILSVAVTLNCDAIHPGVGFLSEQHGKMQE